MGLVRGSHALAELGTELSIREGRAKACRKLQLCLSGEAVGGPEPRWGHCWPAHPVNVGPGTLSSGLSGFPWGQGQRGVTRSDQSRPAPPARPLQARTGERGHAKPVPSAPLLGSPQSGAGGQQGTYRGFGFRGLGLLQPRFADIQVQTPVLEEPPLLLRVGTGTVRRWAAPGDPGPRQGWPRGPSGQDKETEARRRKAIHSE